MSSLNARGGWKFGGSKNESSTAGVITKRVRPPSAEGNVLSSHVAHTLGIASGQC